jgi:capsular polysaccharide biosynthesis protein
MNSITSRLSRSVAITVAAAAVLGALLGLAFVSTTNERYTSETTIAIGAADTVVDNPQLIDIVGSLDRSGIPGTVAGLAASQTVVDAAGTAIALTPDQIGDYDVDATPVLDANLVDIRTTGPDAEIAARLTDAVAAQTQAQFGQLYRVFQLRVVTSASVPGSSDRPSPSLVVFGAAALAAVIALLILSWNSARTRSPAIHAVEA